MEVSERFLNYIRTESQSDEKSGTHPSTGGQLKMAELMVQELKKAGAVDAFMDEKGYVYAHLQATRGMETKPVIGLIAHMDTAPSFSGRNINPSIIEKYDGGDILLNRDRNIVLSPSEYADLLKYVGQTLIVTDGTTLLGADDKAGLAEIITAIEYIVQNNIPHPGIAVGFTPDEEIGEGTDYFDISLLGADYAYTVDGGELGELQYENFNAASAVVTVNGNCIHPGEGKNRMKNSILIAMEFNAMLPAWETPAHTEGYEGFFHLTEIGGNEEKTVLHYIVRDHSMRIFEERKAEMRRIEAYLNEKYGASTIELELKDSYYNMAEKVRPHMEIIDRAKAAFEKNGVTPLINAIRGGTDGARLSFMGLVCPNLSAGGHNFHGKYEYVPVESMETMVRVLVTLLTE